MKELTLDSLLKDKECYTNEENDVISKIAKILKDSNLSYRQKNKVLTFIDDALYTVLVNNH